MNWTLKVYALVDGFENDELHHVPCTSGDNAKDWGRSLTRGILNTWPDGVRCVILDPHGDRWRTADVTPTSHPRRMRWV